ncbi:MAG: hypothetical protein R3293_21605 [Candidatus Promineifilaceae bacterium]|nr:hypothetical protein [Candidatus Promineifilaceae bacterium]
MNTLTNVFPSSKILYYGLGFVLTVISGVALSRTGRPLNSAIFTIHKLAAVGTIILIAIAVFNLGRSVGIQRSALLIILVTGLFFISLVVSGALLSFDKLALLPVLRIHQIAPLLALVFSLITVYLLVGSRS